MVLQSLVAVETSPSHRARSGLRVDVIPLDLPAVGQVERDPLQDREEESCIASDTDRSQRDGALSDLQVRPLAPGGGDDALEWEGLPEAARSQRLAERDAVERVPERRGPLVCRGADHVGLDSRDHPSELFRVAHLRVHRGPAQDMVEERGVDEPQGMAHPR